MKDCKRKNFSQSMNLTYYESLEVGNKSGSFHKNIQLDKV